MANVFTEFIFPMDEPVFNLVRLVDLFHFFFFFNSEVRKTAETMGSDR